MKKILITACNNARPTLWKPIIEKIGVENLYVCTNTPELREMVTKELSPPSSESPQVMTEPSSFKAANAYQLE